MCSIHTKIRKSEGHLKTAAGTKERNGPPHLTGRGTLKLAGSPDHPPAKKALRIGICENVFSFRERKPSDIASRAPQQQKIDPARSYGQDLTVVVTCAVLGLVLGYVVGKADR